MSLADEIKKARENKIVKKAEPMTVKELAVKLDVSSQYLYQLESGTVKTASLPFLIRYSSETGVPIKRFIDQMLPV
jgi:transcriptional regulator with XRE-family HTH domain